MGGRMLGDGQRCQVWVVDVADRSITMCHESDGVLLEAPNWTLDGEALVLNGDGVLWRLDLASGDRVRIPTEGLPDLNNDHVLHPDGANVLVSGEDGHIHRVALAGGRAVRLTGDPTTRQYLHGVSPDGRALAYIETVRDDPRVPGAVTVAPAAGSTDADTGNTGDTGNVLNAGARRLDTGRGHSDGAEFTPDGEWILLNTEAFTDAPGHAQLARIRPDGSGFERLRTSGDVDWFPHMSPDGRYVTFVAFPPGTLGHPADLPVRVRTVAVADWDTVLLDIALFGGQGSLNVNSWSPDGGRFAFVAYPYPADRTVVVDG
ncbi:hypothetical protein AB0F77_35235 [Streptomyces sp. NPDC026672]|uniref:TolB family protein n=1 Tax=unclassified Streptomyces TaxID=2593676 RepID=UPI0033DF5DEB